MKKSFLIGLGAIAVLAAACNSNNKNINDADTILADTTVITTEKSTDGGNTNAANAPMSYTLSFSPDTVVLGNKQEALIRITPVKAIALTDPDGTAKGTELSFKLTITNRLKIGESTVGVNPNDFRLVLDNNTAIAPSSGNYFSAEPESTKEADDVVSFHIPIGVKPQLLNLFYDKNRASVKVSVN